MIPDTLCRACAHHDAYLRAYAALVTALRREHKRRVHLLTLALRSARARAAHRVAFVPNRRIAAVSRARASLAPSPRHS